MAEIKSPHWDENIGVCLKHYSQMLPCPTCAQEQDPDVQAVFSLPEQDQAHFEKFPLSDWLPKNFAYIPPQNYVLL
ncbi:MAG: hypothetical protein KW806_00480 [Candidatus Yanofskybacteria bacterium]|nr:hypothetical protein [Candidatus Yanofskybacteria bacterium]